MSDVAYTVGDSIGSSGGKVEWTHPSGKIYQISLLTLENQSKFERALEREAVRSITNVKDILGESEYSQALDRCLDEISSGKYAFGLPDAQKALGTLKGICSMISILFSITSEEAMKLMAECPELAKVVESVIVRSFPVPEKK